MSTHNGSRRSAGRVQVAVVGTYDVANFGDLLFPLIAEHELEKRLGPLDVALYSYGSKEPPAWPHRVHPVSELRQGISRFDLLLLGGGHSIRADTDIAPGYFPTDPSIHHPLGLWLTPMLRALAAGVPVAWNAPSASSDLPATLAPMLTAALEGSTYVAVRDRSSARTLEGIVPTAEPHVVPDSAFGTGPLLPARPSAEFESLVGSERYVVVQPTFLLLPYRAAICAFAEAAAQVGMSVLELPIGPVHRDEVGVLELPIETIRPSTWPEPLVLAELLVRAQGVVAFSLHAGILALLGGVPFFHPVSPLDSKYEVLDRFPGVHELPPNGARAREWVRLGRGEQSRGVREYAAALGAHWDRVAEAVGSQTPQPGVRDWIVQLEQTGPSAVHPFPNEHSAVEGAEA